MSCPQLRSFDCGSKLKYGARKSATICLLRRAYLNTRSRRRDNAFGQYRASRSRIHVIGIWKEVAVSLDSGCVIIASTHSFDCMLFCSRICVLMSTKLADWRIAPAVPLIGCYFPWPSSSFHRYNYSSIGSLIFISIQWVVHVSASGEAGLGTRCNAHTSN